MPALLRVISINTKKQKNRRDRHAYFFTLSVFFSFSLFFFFAWNDPCTCCNSNQYSPENRFPKSWFRKWWSMKASEGCASVCTANFTYFFHNQKCCRFKWRTPMKQLNERICCKSHNESTRSCRRGTWQRIAFAVNTADFHPACCRKCNSQRDGSQHGIDCEASYPAASTFIFTTVIQKPDCFLGFVISSSPLPAYFL